MCRGTIKGDGGVACFTRPGSERSHRVSPTTVKAKGPGRKSSFVETHHRLKPKSLSDKTYIDISAVNCVHQESKNSVTNFFCDQTVPSTALEMLNRFRIAIIWLFFPLGYLLKTHLIKSNLQSFRRFSKTFLERNRAADSHCCSSKLNCNFHIVIWL